MNRAKRKTFLPFSIAAIFAAAVNTEVPAQNTNTDSFAVHSELSAPGFKPTNYRTVFRGTTVYDATDDVAFRFDLERKLVRIIDRKQNRQTSVTFREIAEFQTSAQALAQAKTQKEPEGLRSFMAAPQFFTSFEPDSRVLRLKSTWLTYEANVEPSSADVVDRFTDYADWTKQLATMMHEGGNLAAARMMLNHELKKKCFVATQVTLKRRNSPDMTCRHQFIHALTEQHWDFMEGIEKELDSLQETSISEFLMARKESQIATNK